MTEQPPFKNRRGLYTSTLGLRFKLKRSHFHQGHVNIKCTATVYKQYFESSEKHLAGRDLGEKALESKRTNGEEKRSCITTEKAINSYMRVGGWGRLSSTIEKKCGLIPTPICTPTSGETSRQAAKNPP